MRAVLLGLLLQAAPEGEGAPAAVLAPVGEGVRGAARPPVREGVRAEARPPVGEGLRVGPLAPVGEGVRAEARPPVGEGLRVGSLAPVGEGVRAEARPPVGEGVRAEARPPVGEGVRVGPLAPVAGAVPPAAGAGLRLGVRTPDGELVTLEVTETSLSAPTPGVLGLQLERRVVGRVGAVLVGDGVERALPAAPPGCALRIEETLLYASALHVSLLRAETTLCGGETTRRTKLQTFLGADPSRRPLTLEALSAKAPVREGGCLVAVADELGVRREEGRAKLRVTLAPSPGCEEPARAALVEASALPPGPALPPEAFAAVREGRKAVFDALPVGAARLLVGRRGLVLQREGKAVATLALGVEAIVSVEPLPALPSAP